MIRRGALHRCVTGVGTPLLADPTPPETSQLPAGVVQINRRNYLMVTTTKDPAAEFPACAEAVRGWQIKVSPSNVATRTAGRHISGYHDPVPTPDSPTAGPSWPTASPVGSRRLYRATPEIHRPVLLAGLGRAGP